MRLPVKTRIALYLIEEGCGASQNIMPGFSPPRQPGRDKGFEPMGASDRIETLDGLRAVAVLGVVLYHYFVRFAATGGGPALYPYANVYAEFPIAKYGFMGVQLFFVVSGFVIAMTLE